MINPQKICCNNPKGRPAIPLLRPTKSTAAAVRCSLSTDAVSIVLPWLRYEFINMFSFLATSRRGPVGCEERNPREATLAIGCHCVQMLRDSIVALRLLLESSRGGPKDDTIETRSALRFCE